MRSWPVKIILRKEKSEENILGILHLRGTDQNNQKHLTEVLKFHLVDKLFNTAFYIVHGVPHLFEISRVNYHIKCF